jgi:hypothetical protein
MRCKRTTPNEVLHGLRRQCWRIRYSCSEPEEFTSRMKLVFEFANKHCQFCCQKIAHNSALVKLHRFSLSCATLSSLSFVDKVLFRLLLPDSTLLLIPSSESPPSQEIRSAITHKPWNHITHPLAKLPVLWYITQKD